MRGMLKPLNKYENFSGSTQILHLILGIIVFLDLVLNTCCHSFHATDY